MSVHGSRLRIYLPLLIALSLAAAASLWSVTGSGAYLTNEGDWQGLAGTYRIGVIDYMVEVDSTVVLDQTSGQAVTNMVVPLKGGVRFYDGSLTDATLRTQEFNEGAAVVKVRIINRSDSLVEVSAALSAVQTELLPFGGTEFASPLRMLALPSALTQSSLEAYNYRSYVLSTLGLSDAGGDEAAGLAAMAEKFAARQGPETVGGNIIRGATGGTPVGTDYVKPDGSKKSYYYKDIFFLLWTEYGAGEHNAALAPGGAAVVPSARLSMELTVGQLD